MNGPPRGPLRRGCGRRKTSEGFPVRLAAKVSLSVVLSPFFLSAQTTITPDFPRLNWQPTQAISGVRYVGTTTCAKCHPAEAETQPSTPMARAAEAVSKCEILLAHPQLTSRDGAYRYEVVKNGPAAVFRVSDGTHEITEPILFAFGQGEAGQTYIFKHHGVYIQSRISFFTDTQGLGRTLGASQAAPFSIEEAAGQPTSESDARLCFGCHMTGSAKDGPLQLEELTPGVTCEGCHGPGEAHVAAFARGDVQTPTIFNPGKLATGDLLDFCGSCHRTAQMVESLKMEGILNVRFQPYRLSNSRCFNPQDRRIGCLACHNPHRPRSRDDDSYDQACLACHKTSASAPATKDKLPRSCTVAAQHCVGCHMPKYELPGGHFKFTDHWIRVVRPKEIYPE